MVRIGGARVAPPTKITSSMESAEHWHSSNALCTRTDDLTFPWQIQLIPSPYHRHLVSPSTLKEGSFSFPFCIVWVIVSSRVGDHLLSNCIRGDSRWGWAGDGWWLMVLIALSEESKRMFERVPFLSLLFPPSTFWNKIIKITKDGRTDVAHAARPSKHKPRRRWRDNFHFQNICINIIIAFTENLPTPSIFIFCSIVYSTSIHHYYSYVWTSFLLVKTQHKWSYELTKVRLILNFSNHQKALISPPPRDPPTNSEPHLPHT